MSNLNSWAQKQVDWTKNKWVRLCGKWSLEVNGSLLSFVSVELHFIWTSWRVFWQKQLMFKHSNSFSIRRTKTSLKEDKIIFLFHSFSFKCYFCWKVIAGPSVGEAGLKKQSLFWILWILTDSSKWSKININGSSISTLSLHTSQMKGIFIQQNQKLLLIIALHFRPSLVHWSTSASMNWMCHQIEASFQSSDYKIPVDCIEKVGEDLDLYISTILHFRQWCQDITESVKTPLGAVAFVLFDVLFYTCTRSS